MLLGIAQPLILLQYLILLKAEEEKEKKYEAR